MAKRVIPDPPAHLSQRALDLRQSIVPRRAKSYGRIALLDEALAARDRAEQFRALIAKRGVITVTKKTGAVHLNPLVKAEREARQLFAKIWHALHLEWDPDIDSSI